MFHVGGLSGGPKGGRLKGGHLKWDFAVKFALDTALSKAIPQGALRLKALSRLQRVLRNAILRFLG